MLTAKFAELFRQGKVCAEDADDWIDRWHEGDSPETLSQYLGFPTLKDYFEWLDKYYK